MLCARRDKQPRCPAELESSAKSALNMIASHEYGMSDALLQVMDACYVCDVLLKLWDPCQH